MLPRVKCSATLLGMVFAWFLVAPNAHADTVATFNVSGVANAMQGQGCAATCLFSGTLTIDVTSGTVDGVDITFPGLSAFDTLTSSGSFVSTWSIFADNSAQDVLLLDFNTTPTPGSLVGFNGGTIFYASAVDSTGVPLYGASSVTSVGSITPVSSVVTPEPSSLALMLLGIAVVPLVRKHIGQPPQQLS